MMSSHNRIGRKVKQKVQVRFFLLKNNLKNKMLKMKEKIISDVVFSVRGTRTLDDIYPKCNIAI